MPDSPLSHPEAMLSELRQTRSAILARFPRARFVAFWDLDGTLLHGDCSEGLSVGGRRVYSGLVQVGIEQGLSGAYRGPDGFGRAMEDYALLKERIGPWIAYPFLAQLFAGASEEALAALARDHFQGTLSRHLYPDAMRLFGGLAALGIEQHVISASAEVFVRGAALCLGTPAHRLHGIRLRAPGGRLTRELAYPVTYAEGKVARLKQIVRSSQTESLDRPVFVLGAFGDSADNDGPFLAHVARIALPAGSTVAALVNAPTDPLGPLIRGLTFAPATPAA